MEPVTVPAVQAPSNVSAASQALARSSGAAAESGTQDEAVTDILFGRTREGGRIRGGVGTR